MATLYCDFENGNDNYAGSSFALLAQGTDGRIGSASGGFSTFSSATASFPNDGSLINQYLSIFNGTIYSIYQITAYVSSTSLTITRLNGTDSTPLAVQSVDRQFYIGGRWKNLTTGATAVRTSPGDTIRIMGSPAPTSLGQNGVWTSQALQGTKIIGLYSTSNPTTVTITDGHGFSTGDTIVISGVNINTQLNGTWEITVTGSTTFTIPVSGGSGGGSGTLRLRNNTRVMLTTAVTQNIACTGPGRAAWTATAGGNITTAFDTSNFKEHNQADSIAIAAGFTTGLAAYWATPSTLDLSGYQQVSFWIRQTTGTIGAAGAVDLRLCSDNAGVTAVNTISIPALGATGRWMPVTVDLATNLGNSIQSIAFYVNTDNGAQTFLLSNIIACKASSAADSLTLTSLIGKNTTGETFWGIQSINGTRVMLDADTNATPTSTNVRGYYGTSETVTTWKRETIKLGPSASATTDLQTIQDSGTEGSPITFSGGWDRTAMTTQNLETWFDGVNGNGRALNASGRSWLKFDNLSGVRLSSFYTATGRNNIFQIKHYNNNSAGVAPFNNSATISTTTSIEYAVANTGDVVFEGGARLNQFILGKILSNSQSAIENTSYGTTQSIQSFDSNALIANNGAAAIIARFPRIIGIKTADNSSGLTAEAGNYYLTDCQFDETSEVSVPADYTTMVFSHNHDKTTGNHKIFMNGALISAATDQRHTASGISWKIQPTSTSRDSVWPVTLSLAKVACAANSLVTIKAWMYRDNSGLTMRLVCKGGQIAGVANDVTSSVTTTNAWEELTITFTPTETGVVEITAEAWGGTTFSGWVDDMTISQA